MTFGGCAKILEYTSIASRQGASNTEHSCWRYFHIGHVGSRVAEWLTSQAASHPCQLQRGRGPVRCCTEYMVLAMHLPSSYHPTQRSAVGFITGPSGRLEAWKKSLSLGCGEHESSLPFTSVHQDDSAYICLECCRCQPRAI